MQVETMHIADTTDQEKDQTLLLVDGKTLIMVEAFGSSLYRWKVQNNNGRLADYDPIAILKEVCGEPGEDGMWEGTPTLGHALVWANPITFAHVVMDLINNQ